jgi:CubicO group peptidase (beta-lactamase class C family)
MARHTCWDIACALIIDRVSSHRSRPAPTVGVSGSCDPEFAAVRDAFTANFASRDELGASLCVAIEGRVVVDLWGGYADGARTRPWTADTLVNAFSVGKAFTALCLHRLASQGLIDSDDRVAAHWPESGAQPPGGTAGDQATAAAGCDAALGDDDQRPGR